MGKKHKWYRGYRKRRRGPGGRKEKEKGGVVGIKISRIEAVCVCVRDTANLINLLVVVVVGFW